MLAHHLIPLEALSDYKSLLQKGANGGFDLNGEFNGYLLNAAEHVGGHPVYNRVVLDELQRINDQVRKLGLSDADVAGLLQTAADTLRDAIKNGTFGPWG
jgi:hypothetical protein